MSVRPVPRLQFTRFVAFGDSLTAGVVSPGGLLPSESYPFKLERLLSNRYTKQSIAVRNSGLPGELASQGGKQRLQGELLATQPEVLLLMEGANDLFMYLEAGVSIGIAALEDLVREGKHRGVRVFLATIPPQRSGGARNRVASIVPRFNDEIRAVAARQSVTLIDVYGAIEPNLDGLIGPDDLHLTPDGYAVVAQRFYDVIVASLEAPLAITRPYVP